MTANLTRVSYASAFIMAIVLAFLTGLFLLISLKIFKVEGRNYWYAYLLVLANGIVNALLNIFVSGKINNILLTILGVVISFAIVALPIKSKYKLDLGKATLVWLLWAVFNFIVTVFLALIISKFGIFVAGMAGA